MKKENPSKEKLKMIYRDILNGYTAVKVKNRGTAHIKHLTSSDSVELDEVFEESKNKAVKMGINTKEQQVEYLKEEKLWTAKEDDELSEALVYLDSLRQTKSKLYLKSQIDQIKEEMEETEAKASRLESSKREMLGVTAESYAEKRVNEYYMLHVMYKDKEFKEILIPEEEFEEMDDIRLGEVIKYYNDATKLFNSHSFKLVALSAFMANSFALCDNNPFTFYGRPVVNLTFFQIEIFSHAAYFKHVLQDSKVKPPSNLMNDPEELIEWFEASKNAEEMVDKMKGEGAGGSSLVGATKDDLERLGLSKKQTGQKSLSAEAAKRGGSLTMDDFAEIHS